MPKSRQPSQERELAAGRRVYLRAWQAADAREFAAKARASRRYHAGLVQPPMTAAQFKQRLERYRSERHVGLMLCSCSNGEILGALAINEIVRGAFHSAYLGYYLFEEFAGQGFMSEGLRLCLGYAFVDLGLHRLEANIQPQNLSSKALVERLGFELEGYSRKYLKISGRWRDHERWAILRGD